MYTQAELEEAIAKIVRTSIRRPYGTLGNREVNLTFDDTRDAAAGVFILYPSAVYYVIRLAVQRLQDTIALANNVLDDFESTVRAVDRYVTPVKTLSSLSNAKVALDDLASALGARTAAFRDLEEVPAYQRFQKNTTRFLREASSNIRSGGALVRTPTESRGRLGDLMRDFKELHAEIVRRVGSLVSAVDDFSGMNLPGQLSRSIIDNARSVLQGRLEELTALTPDQRLEVLRGVTLDILATRAAVKGFGSLTPPTTFLDVEGTGQVFADDSHQATPASLTSDHGPFKVVPYLTDGATGVGGDILDFVAESDALPVSMMGSYVARLEGTVKEPYDIGDPNSQGMKNDVIVIALTNYPSVGTTSTYTVSLITDLTKSAREVCNEVNATVPAGVPLIAEPYANPLRFMGSVDIDTTGVPNDVRFTSTNPLTDFTLLGALAGDRLIVRSSGAHQGRVYQVVTVGTTTLDCVSVDVAPIVADELNKTIELGAGNLAIRFRITDLLDSPRPEYRLTALQNRVGILFPPDVGTAVVQRDSVSTYGFLPRIATTSSPTSASDTVRAFRASLGTAPLGTTRLDAETIFDPYLYVGVGRTDPDNIQRVILTKFQAQGLVSAGTSVTFSVSGAEAAGVVVGDTLIIRSHPTPAQVGNKGTITAVSGTSVVATMGTTVLAATVDIEVGPTLSLPFDAVLQVSGGTPNDGEYTVSSSNAFDLTVFPSVPVTNLAGKRPLTFDVALGLHKVVFTTLDATLSTAITVGDVSTGSARGQFFPGPLYSAFGTTSFFQLAALPAGIEVGDVLELYVSSFDTPSISSRIVSIEADLRLLELETPLPTDMGSFTFSKNVPIPFARIRKTRLDTFTTLRDGIEGLDSDWMQASALRDLTRLLNAVLANNNPTLAQVGAVVDQLAVFSTGLDALETELEAYTADVVPAVDSLLETFREKGAERALDFLLEARFSEFFGLSQDGVSYAGALEQAVREVQKNDLPIRRTARAGKVLAEMGTIAAYDDTDFEYDRSDIDGGAELDIPGAQGIPFPGQSY